LSPWYQRGLTFARVRDGVGCRYCLPVFGERYSDNEAAYSFPVNVCCVIISQFESGIDPVFWKPQPQTAEVIDAAPIQESAATVVAPVARSQWT
jgi:hypothetical protein